MARKVTSEVNVVLTQREVRMVVCALGSLSHSALDSLMMEDNQDQMVDGEMDLLYNFFDGLKG